MTTLYEEFFNYVLPSPSQDYYAVAYLNFFKLDEKGKPISWSHATKSKGTLKWLIEKAVSEQVDVYLVIGTQVSARPPKEGRKIERAHRSTENMGHLQSLFIDVDAVNKGYPTTADADAAIKKFCTDTGLPRPTLYVHSGSGGIQPHWILTEPLPAAEWIPRAHALAHATRTEGLVCDAQCTVDVTRFLRIPGTYNNKDVTTPKPVWMEKPGPRYDLALIDACLDKYKGPRLVTAPNVKGGGLTLPGVSAKFAAGMADAMQSPPVDLLAVADAGCGVFADAIDNGGANLTGQPLWNLLMLGASFAEDGEDYAHLMCQDNPDYNEADTQAMYERKVREQAKQNIGWPSCVQFNLVAPQCQTCPHWGKVKSPFNLPSHVKQKPQTPSGDLPDPFWRDPSNRIMAPDKNGDSQIVVATSTWEAQLTDEGDFTCMALIGGADRRIFLERTETAERQKLVTTLAYNHLMVPNEWAQGKLKELFMGWIRKLQDSQTPRMTVANVGWDRATKKFTYGKHTYSPQGAEEAFFRDDDAYRYYQPTGDLAVWQDCAKLVTDQNNPALHIILAAALAGPLVRLAGLPGMLLSAYSNQSGTGKTTAIQIAQAFWGHPVKGVNILDDTPASVMKKLADIQSLTLFWDELKLKKEIDTFLAFVFRLTQGRDKARLDRNARAREIGDFATLMVAASNNSLSDAISLHEDMTMAGANRVFEIVVPELTSSLSPTDVLQNIHRLHTNYGKAGEVYAAYLGTHSAMLRGQIETTAKHLETKLGAKQQERFWIGTMACLIVGAQVARNLRLADLDVKGIYQFLADTYEGQFMSRNETVLNPKTAEAAEEVINRFILEASGSGMLLVTDTVHNTPGKAAPNQVHNANGSLKAVCAQVGLEDNILRVKKKDFLKWMWDRRLTYANYEAKFTADYNATTKKATLGAGCSAHVVQALAKTQTTVVDFKLPTVPSGVAGLPPLGSASPT